MKKKKRNENNTLENSSGIPMINMPCARLDQTT